MLRLPLALAFASAATAAHGVSPHAIPLGDGHVGSTPRVGSVDSCETSFHGGGAQVAGPWIDAQARTWDLTKKLAVAGSVRWPAASFAVRTTRTARVFVFNDLPTNHATGDFPIQPGDPAHAYDANPNRIAAQPTTWAVPLHPARATKPSCLSLGAIGVLTDGVYLYDSLDAGGRDAAAYEVLDACGGHPDPSSSYHHHNVPQCLLSRAPKGASTLVGYALDGFGIYVTKDASGALPTNADLDACHGATSTVRWNGKPTRIYHYVATLEYPYTVGCYRGTPRPAR